MSENNELDKNLMDHEYDGIKELDNPLPSWWVATFYLTILFSAVYVLYFHILDGPSIEKEYRTELAQLEMTRSNSQKGNEGPDDKKFQEALSDGQTLSKGKASFQTKCASCHGDLGQGGIGPNLTDNAWIHGNGKMDDIFQLINKGALDKGMPAWEFAMPQEERIAVTAYIKSLEGSNPPGAKAPQGKKVN